MRPLLADGIGSGQPTQIALLHRTGEKDQTGATRPAGGGNRFGTATGVVDVQPLATAFASAFPGDLPNLGAATAAGSLPLAILLVVTGVVAMAGFTPLATAIGVDSRIVTQSLLFQHRHQTTDQGQGGDESQQERPAEATQRQCLHKLIKARGNQGANSRTTWAARDDVHDVEGGASLQSAGISVDSAVAWRAVDWIDICGAYR